MTRYESAKAMYAAYGVDTDAAIAKLKDVPVALHCWQGDDVRGFDTDPTKPLTGGIQTTGNYPGKAKTPDQLMADMDVAIKNIGGVLKLNLHASYAIFEKGEYADRNALEPKHFAPWVAFAKERGMGIDFNPTCFSHPKSSDGLTLSHPDEGIRNFWIEHCIRSREISEYLGKRTGVRSVNNIWVPDGYKDNCFDKLAPRARLLDSLNKIEAKKFDSKYTRDAVESKVFAVGVEAYTVGSHEFYMGYAMKNPEVMLCLDAGHFHPGSRFGFGAWF